MIKNIKEQIKEIIEIVNLCPANLQEKCFDILLSDIIKSDKTKDEGHPKKDEVPDKKESEDKNKNINLVSNGEEFEMKDFHTKTKKIIPKELTLEEINNLFYKEGEEIKPLYDDLKSSKVAESQMRVAIMEALKNGLKTGDFSFNTQTVRELCESYKCYDSANFSAHFKKNGGLFNEEYKNNIIMSLSADGKKEMVKIAKDLSQ
ncbi:MAG TPA: hypothetical protein PKZ36_00295 [Candidatus Paceibacterota bacterium]|nr:hypothetical protein [Candidatus Paceibacterota bacterium]HPT17842.1 hypothetical protein [Candidatus Paceibacterota bacterium]